MDALIVSADYIETPVSVPDCGSLGYTIQYVTDGYADLVSGKERWHIKTGQIAIYDSKCKCVLDQSGSNFSCYILGIRKFSSSEIVRYYKVYSKTFGNEAGMPIIQTLDESLHEVQHIFDRITKEFENKRNLQSDVLDLLLHELLIRIFRDKIYEFISGDEEKQKIVASIQKRLNTEYDKTITIGQIACDFNMSDSHLSHLFKEMTGISIMKYLLNCRIAAARKYLSESTLSVGEIVWKCGFTDCSNFSRVFKREVGCSPTQYRKLTNKER